VQAHVDGELDAISSLNIEQHMRQCADCSDLHQALVRTRGILKQRLGNERASPSLRARVQASLDKEDAAPGGIVAGKARRRWRDPAFWWGSVAGAAATAAVAVVIVSLPMANPSVDAVLAAHVQSLASAHLIDVVSTDRHTVKPWFAGRVEVSPVVADFESRGYALIGGRVDGLMHQRAAVTVYRHGAHVINVFCWRAPAGPLPRDVTRVGYHMAFWKVGDLAYAAASDTGWDELFGLERLLRAKAEAESGPPDVPKRE
jgi:anti-sigma factor RsiW